MKKRYSYIVMMTLLLTGCGASVPILSLPVAHAAVENPSDAAPEAASTPGQIPDPVMLEMQDAYVRLTEHIRPFVVNIDTEGTTDIQQADPRQFDELFRFFGMPFGPDTRQMPKQMRMALGSGFIYDKEGHIITNNHMVEGAQKIKVKTSTGKEYEAKVVGRDPDTDLAVIKIDPEEELAVATLGDSDQLKSGDFTIACGSPRGFEGSFTYGHVSALGRNQLDLPGLRFQNFIQTDAAINPGNSGGPLCNLKGEVVGINVAIVYGANALGFAIPANTAKEIIPALIGDGKITRGFLGVGVTDAGEFKDAVGLPDNKGAFVKTVNPDSPAEQAGIKPYDVIRKVNGTEVNNSANLIQLISSVPPNHEVTLEIWRDKKTMEVKTKVMEYQGTVENAEAIEQETLGIQVETLTPEMLNRLQLKNTITGVVITDIDPTSPAMYAGLEPGDVITEVAQQKVNDTNDFARLVKENAQPGKSLLIGFVRNGEHDITVIRIPK